MVRVAAFDLDGTIIDGESPLKLTTSLLRHRQLPVHKAILMGIWGIRYRLRLPQVESCLLYTSILAIDMYVPALPGLLHEFDTTASFLNLTMFMFMFVSAFAILVSGPLSDKFGRKPVLVASCAIFAVSSFGCALSTSVLMLTTFRIGQAVGFGLVETDVTALIKDCLLYTSRCV